jgi:hypothetical protein
MRLLWGPPWFGVAVQIDEAGRAGGLQRYLERAGGREAEGGGEAEVVVTFGEVREAKEEFKLRRGILEAAGKYGRGKFDFGSARGEVTISDLGALFLDNFLKQLFVWESYRRGGVVFHSVGFGAGGDAVLSCGPSESGKSTLAKMLAAGFQVFSDEANAVFEDGKVSALPFVGAGMGTARYDDCSLRAITFHHRGTAFGCSCIPPAEAAHGLSRNIFVPAAADGVIKEKALSRIAKLAALVAAFDVTVPLEERPVVEGFRELLRREVTRRGREI